MSYFHKINTKPLLLALLTFTVTCMSLKAENLYTITELEGKWKFSVGDNEEWSKSGFDDSDWNKVYIPNNWENQGYKNYNGYAWYRKHFSLNSSIDKEWVYLSLGYIDDADEVYLNGVLVGGMGGMQKRPETAYNIERRYPVPVSLLNTKGKNTIAVRVYDFYSSGGIYSGDIGIYYDKDYKYIDVDLSGRWWFETEDEINARLKDKSLKPQNKIWVPSYWESQGYNCYDGKGRYSRNFNITGNILDEDLYIILGYIDDIETVYINGEKIGSVSQLEKKKGMPYYLLFRAYKIPKNLLKDGDNTVSVLIYDKGGPGGIFKGPIGIATESNYETIKKEDENDFESIWDFIFYSPND